ncbi:aldehyde dehydrogenase family protein [Thermospira aquatica]|uniref:Aldehyde dehydrogenase n=1 Tax=Thermospira aquatica TaxID=2828656 RepID=A0AAX3BFT1_9SPIR|nr:aldehyde dehydrogenase family protein [Thermospira aquatica]URA11257.1 aldehyde dehydrogenase [Thermospira aquatica]
MIPLWSEVAQEKDGIPHFHLLIDGCWRCLSSGESQDVINPATGEVIGRVPLANNQDAENAIQAAYRFFEKLSFDPLERLEIMKKAAEILASVREDMAKTIVLESGKPISVAFSEVDATIERLRLVEEEVRVLYGEYLPGEWVHDTKGKFAIVKRRPLGVVAAIAPFNYPLFIGAAKIIPALLAGNTVVVKPASDTPISLILFVRILEKAGIPQGAIHILTGSGKEIGDTLVTHPLVKAISFTGSTQVGEYIASRAGMKRLHLELGGKAAALVFADADIQKTASLLCKGAFRNSGQRCDAVSRVLVEESIAPQLIEALVEESKNYSCGDPMDPKTPMGTVINEAAATRLDGLLADAREKQARFLVEKKRNNLFYPPHIVEISTDCRLAWEEIFGPILPIIRVKNEEEAIRLANASEYGLDSCVFTQDITRAFRVAEALHDGSVTINAIPAHGVGHFPFGGNKRSGIGREGIKYSIDELTELHTIIVNLG